MVLKLLLCKRCLWWGPATKKNRRMSEINNMENRQFSKLQVPPTHHAVKC